MEFPGGRRCCSPAHPTGRPSVPHTLVSRRGSPRSRPQGHGPPAGEPPPDHLTKQEYENSSLTGELFFFFSRRAAKTGCANRLPLAAPWQPIKLSKAGHVSCSGWSQKITSNRPSKTTTKTKTTIRKSSALSQYKQLRKVDIFKEGPATPFHQPTSHNVAILTG